MSLKRKLIASVSALLAAAAIVIFDISPVSAAEPAFSLTISVPRDTIKTGAEVRIRIVQKNATNHRIWLGRVLSSDPSRDDASDYLYVVDVLSDRGIRAPYTKYGKEHAEAIGADGSVTVFPVPVDGQLEDAVVVSRQYDLSASGRYSIQVRQFDSVSKTWVRSNTIIVTIAP